MVRADSALAIAQPNARGFMPFFHPSFFIWQVKIGVKPTRYACSPGNKRVTSRFDPGFIPGFIGFDQRLSAASRFWASATSGNLFAGRFQGLGYQGRAWPRRRQWCGALLAKLGVRRILRVAGGTLHRCLFRFSLACPEHNKEGSPGHQSTSAPCLKARE